MSIEGVGAASAAASGAARPQRAARVFDKLTVGETLQLRVLERLGARDYLVAFGGQEHRVESAIALEVGADVRVGVVAIGERLVLRQLDARAKDETADGGDLLGQLAQRYGVSLAAQERGLLLTAAAGTADPATMLLSGLYLAKLGIAPEQQAIAAVYEAQREDSDGAGDDTAASVRDQSSLESADVAVEWFAEAFGPGGAHPDTGDGASQDRRDADDLAHWALNLQDDGSVLYRYATLPLVIGGELRELQVALFTPREPVARESEVRRLVMTLETPQLRQVRIEAKSVGDRLAVAIDVAAPHGMEALAERESEVRELLARLGWSVEAVSYGINVPPDRAARRIVEHVLTAGTVDAVF